VALLSHVETCGECRQALADASPAGIVPLLLDSSEPHLTEDEMAAFVSGRMPEAARHVAGCVLCRESVAVMEAVAKEAVAKETEAIQAVRTRPPGRLAWIATLIGVAAIVIVAVAIRLRPAPTAEPAPRVLASVADAGGTVELEVGGAVRGIEGASPEETTQIRDALTKRRLPAGPAFPTEKPGVLLAPGSGVSPAFSVTAPLNSRVLSDRPVFSWSRAPGATAYEVVVTLENLDPVGRSGRITAAQWQPGQPLPRGVLLLWQVRAWHGGQMESAPAPPEPPARFEIAPAEVAARLERLRSSPRPSHLLAAILCAREGLGDEAAKELQDLRRENPESSLVQALADSL
jgi:hypothetical protein